MVSKTDSFISKLLHSDIRASLILTAGTGLSSVFTFVFMAYVGRKLGPEASSVFYTAIFFIFAIGTFLTPFADAAAKFSAELNAEQKNHLNHKLVWYLLGALAVTWLGMSVLVQGLSFFFADYDFNKDFLLLAVTLFSGLLVTCLRVFRSLSRGLELYAYQTQNLVAETLMRLLLLFAVAKIVMSSLSVISIYAFASALALIWIYKQLFSTTQKIEAVVDKKNINQFMLPMFFVALATAGYENFEILYSKANFSDVDAGLLGAAMSISKVVNVISVPFIILMLPLLTLRLTEGGEIFPTLIRLSAFFILISGSVIGLLFFIGEEIMVLIFGEAYVGAVDMLYFLVISAFLQAFSLMLIQASAAIAKTGLLAIYFLGFLLEIAVLALFSTSVQEVVELALWVKVGVFVILSCYFVGLFLKTQTGLKASS